MSSVQCVEPDLFAGPVSNIISQFDSLSSTDAFVDFFRRCIFSAGFDFFLIGGVPSTIEPVSKMILLHNYPEVWVRKYIKNSYFEIDPVAQFCKETTEPFFWHEAQSRYKAEPAYTRLMEEAAAFNLKWGVCIPIHNINECEACISLAAREPCIGETDLPLIQLFCTYAFHKAKLLKKSELFSARKLSHRERDVLTCAAIGKTAAETAAVFNLTVNTVNFHIQNAMFKLGARNKTEAIAEAIRQKMISV